MKLNTFLQTAQQWFTQTPERSLDEAYRAALAIKNIEDQHFQGQKVSPESSQYSNSVLAYFQGEVKRYVQTAKMRLAVFKASRYFLNLGHVEPKQLEDGDRGFHLEHYHQPSIFIEKLKFIDEIISKYEADISSENENFLNKDIKENGKFSSSSNNFSQSPQKKQVNSNGAKLDSASKKTGVLPRSFLKTINRIKQEIDPKSEETEAQVLKKFRKSRYQTAISIKFILILIIVPLLIHQVTKTLFLAPLVKNYFAEHAQVVFINHDLEEEAFIELHNFEESLHFKNLIGLGPELSQKEIEEQLKEKAKEIAEHSRHQGAEAIANIFADIFSLIAFGIVIFTNKEEIEIVKSFLDEILYSLSDSAKAFLIILFTDMFVGFHSPHGWEVILEGISRHLGLPENREFNFLFIATFPVILDTVLKYWIFRYLNRISPSSVATYRNMNE